MKSKQISNRPLTMEQVLFANVLEQLNYSTDKVVAFFSSFLDPTSVRVCGNRQKNPNLNARVYHKIAKEMLPID